MPADFVISQSFAVPRERMFTLWTDGNFHFCMQSPD